MAMAALSALAAGCRPPAPDAPPPAPPTVTVAPAVSEPVVEHEVVAARLEAVESVEIRPRVSGYLAEVRFQPGQLVAKDDILFVIDPRPFDAALQRAAADAEQARTRLDLAEREDRRSAELLASQAISREEADQRHSQWAAARAALASAEASLATARLHREYAEVRSPIGGRIGRALVTPGNNVSGVDGFTTLLATVVSVDPIHVYASVSEDSFLRLQHLDGSVDGPLEVALGLADDDGFPRAGRIESFDNRVDPGTGTLVLRCEFPNPDGHLVPGLFGRLRIPLTGPRPSVVVSERAIGTDQSQKFVYTLTSSNTAAYRPVVLGPLVGKGRVIRSGLSAGEPVIVNGLQRVQPGQPVTPEPATAGDGTGSGSGTP